MSVRIKELRKLNANAYNKMIIREVDDDYFVKVDGEKLDDQYVSISYRLSDNLRKKNATEKIISIVDSFLENTEVDNIETSVLCPGCSGEFIGISGTRKLYLQINNPELLKTIIKMIKDKYDRDRYKYCCNNDINSSYGIFLNQKQSSYSRQCMSCFDCLGCDNEEYVCPNYIQFKLMYVNGKMAPFDEKFISRFIYDKLWEFGDEAKVIEKTHDIKLVDGYKVGECTDGYLISCRNLNIMFNCTAFSREYVFNFCNKIVNRYNSELRKSDKIKKKQLKMEGF